MGEIGSMPLTQSQRANWQSMNNWLRLRQKLSRNANADVLATRVRRSNGSPSLSSLRLRICWFIWTLWQTRTFLTFLCAFSSSILLHSPSECMHIIQCTFRTHHKLIYGDNETSRRSVINLRSPNLFFQNAAHFFRSAVGPRGRGRESRLRAPGIPVPQ